MASTSKSRELIWSARPLDPHSFSQPEKIFVHHVDLEIKVGFERRVLDGTATLHLFRNPEYPDAPLILDTRDLSIQSIEAATDHESFERVRHEFGSADPILGTPLRVHLPRNATSVRISYSTSPNATALQWLDAEQTAGKKAPFLFTQSQEIHARSWIPLQDTPGVRITYSATIETPTDLLAVMSDCRRVSVSRQGSYRFDMTYPIPPYLIALAVGDIDFAPTGPRTGVYAEPPLLEAARYEFAEADRMLQAAERLYGTYLWGRFDVLVLPPSFPFGGMENPGVAFVTPTLIAGDRSSVSVIAHELAHAWSGNLVTNATWSDFWLNEGFTTYTERRIQEELYGSSRANMEEVLAEERLANEMKNLPPEDQLLHPDLEGRNPETTLVPYVKGALFLKTLENTFGRDLFDAYLRSYFEHFAFKSITTAEAIDYLKTTLLDNHPHLSAKIPLEEWLCAPGLPASAPKAVSPVLMEIRKLAHAWSADQISTDDLWAQDWNTQQKLHFLDSLPPDVGFAKMHELDQRFQVTESVNAEILYRWLLLAVRNKYEPAYSRLERFLTTVGRIIYVKPLYEELAKTEPGKAFAEAIYSRARPSYHPLTQAIVDKILVP